MGGSQANGLAPRYKNLLPDPKECVTLAWNGLSLALPLAVTIARGAPEDRAEEGCGRRRRRMHKRRISDGSIGLLTEQAAVSPYARVLRGRGRPRSGRAAPGTRHLNLDLVARAGEPRCPLWSLQLYIGKRHRKGSLPRRGIRNGDPSHAGGGCSAPARVKRLDRSAREYAPTIRSAICSSG